MSRANRELIEPGKSMRVNFGNRAQKLIESTAQLSGIDWWLNTTALLVLKSLKALRQEVLGLFIIQHTESCWEGKDERRREMSGAVKSID